VGSSLALNLLSGGHTVAIIDRRAEAFRRLPEDFSGITVQGIGFDRDRLIEAGIEKAGALAAVTNGDNSNILIARVARERFGIERVIARIYDPRRAAIYERVGIATIATVQWATERVMRRIVPDAGEVEWIDPSAKVVLVERLVPRGLVGKKVELVDEEAPARVAAVSRLGQSSVADPKLVLQEGDVLYLAVGGDDTAKLDEWLAAAGTKGSH
jgi:trk system potassium uptake protein TrkA